MNDNVDENMEQFSLTISSANEGDIAAIDTITVNIADADKPTATGGTSSVGSNGSNNTSSDSGGGSSGILLVLLMPFVLARRTK